jgi:hypothetical protein
MLLQSSQVSSSLQNKEKSSDKHVQKLVAFEFNWKITLNNNYLKYAIFYLYLM